MSELDIRLAVGVEDHPKTLKLIKRCGEISFRCLTRLWGQARMRFPSTGILEGWTKEDIELAAKWPMDRENEFINALIEVGFVEVYQSENGIVYALHDWITEQPYAIESEIRRANARKAGIASGESRRRKSLEMSGSNGIRLKHQPSELKPDMSSNPRGGVRK